MVGNLFLTDTRMKPLIFIFLFLLSSAASADISGTALIVDSDTITISGTKVRISGIDTLHRKQICKKPVSHGNAVIKPLKP